MLVATSTGRTAIIVFLLSLSIVLGSTLWIIFGVSAILRFFSFLKVCAVLWKPEEAVFVLKKILIDFFSYFLQSLSNNSIRLSKLSFSQFAVKFVVMLAPTLFSRISYLFECRSCKCISDLNFPIVGDVRISVCSFVSFSMIRERKFLGVWVNFFPVTFYKHQIFVLIDNIAKMLAFQNLAY